MRIVLRRNDEAFLDALGTESIPDPTTAGDFCRRFDADNVEQLMAIINDVRVDVWRRQGAELTSCTAVIDADGSVVATGGECKEGMSLTYNGIWGYQPLIISLENTAEPLFIVNRSGNRPSAEGAACYLDKAIALCRKGGFKDVLLRGDTAFSQTTELDRWDTDGVRFVFGYNAVKNLVAYAKGLNKQEDYRELERLAQRCNQENLLAQLKGGVRALHAPVNTLNANWAYMVMASLAWTLKAWMALSLPIQPRWIDKHRAEREVWLRMEFRSFLNAVINIPAQVVRTAGTLVVRLLAWRPQLPMLFRLLDAL